MAAPVVPATPLSELGYAKQGSQTWWTDDNEPAPELRWPLSVNVYDRMTLQDAQVVSVLQAVTRPVDRTPWWIEPNGARDEVVEHVARDFGLPIKGEAEPPGRRTRDRFSWQDHLRLALLELVYGHSVFEQVYRVDDPTNPRKLHLRKLAWRPPQTIAAFNTAPDGGLISVEQYGYEPGRRGVVLPVERLVVYCQDRRGAAWQGRSLLRPAYKHWLLKDRLMRVQAQTIDRNGMGVPIYTGAEDETDLSAGLKIARTYRSGESAGTAIPHGATLKLAGVEGQTPNADPAIRYHDEQIARAVLAHFLNLGTQTGSWALGTTFADFFTLSLQSIAEQIRDVTTQHAVEDLVDVNWGEDEPSPRIGFEEIGSRQAATAQAIKLLADAGIILPDRSLEEELRRGYGLPPKDARPDRPNPNADAPQPVPPTDPTTPEPPA